MAESDRRPTDSGQVGAMYRARRPPARRWALGGDGDTPKVWQLGLTSEVPPLIHSRCTKDPPCLLQF